MVRLWCRAYAAEIDFVVDYQPWVVANFSGILCVDEVYQGDRALLLAVDPATPDGDRLVGYTLLPRTKEVDQRMVRAFINRLRAAGVQPNEVITDDSRLYPAVLTEIWPAFRVSTIVSAETWRSACQPRNRSSSSGRNGASRSEQIWTAARRCHGSSVR